MANLLSGGVVRGLVGASSAMKVANTAMSVYVQAKARKDETTMKRAYGYAADKMGIAMDAVEESKAALTENIHAAREQEQVEQADRLEKTRQESARKRDEIQSDTGDSNENIKKSIDIIKISPEAVTALQSEHSITYVQSENIFDDNIKQREHHVEKYAAMKYATPNTQIVHVKGNTGESAIIKHRRLNIKV